MKTITLPKTEYNQLRGIKKKYETIRQLIELDFFSKPATKNSKKIIKEFRSTGLYNEEFLASLQTGLKESSYFN